MGDCAELSDRIEEILEKEFKKREASSGGRPDMCSQ